MPGQADDLSSDPIHYQRRPQIGNVSIDASDAGASIVLHSQSMSRREIIDILIIQMLGLLFSLFAGSALGVLTGYIVVAVLPIAAWLIWSGISWRRRYVERGSSAASITATAEGFEQSYSRGRAETLKLPRALIADVVARMSPRTYKADPVTLCLRLTTGEEIEIGRGSLAEAEAIEIALRKGLGLNHATSSQGVVPSAD